MMGRSGVVMRLRLHLVEVEAVGLRPSNFTIIIIIIIIRLVMEKLVT